MNWFTVTKFRLLSHVISSVLLLGLTTVPYHVAAGMDWDTAAEVATCSNRSGYEQLGVQTIALLTDHKIRSMLLYFAEPDKFGDEGLVTNSNQAGRWGVYVHIRDASAARKLIAKEIEHGLKVTISTKDPAESDPRCNVPVARMTISQNHKPPEEMLTLQKLLRDKGIKSELGLIDQGPDLKGQTMTRWSATVHSEDAERARRCVSEARGGGLRVEPSSAESNIIFP